MKRQMLAGIGLGALRLWRTLGFDLGDVRTFVKHLLAAALMIGWAGAVGLALRTFWMAAGLGGG